MNEMMLIAKKKDTTLIDVSFEDSEVGDVGFADKAGRIWTRAGASAGASVQVEPITGKKMMKFDGKSYFRTPLTPDLYLNSTDWQMTIEFVPVTKNYTKLLSTGDYPSPGGMALSLNQYAATYIQAFLEQGGTNFTRLMANLTNTLVPEKVVITRVRGKAWQMSIFRNDVQVASASVGAYSIGDGSTSAGFLVGTTAGSPGAQLYDGYWKSLKLERL